MPYLYYVDCPLCKSATVIRFDVTIPDRNNECVAVCEVCKKPFRLLTPDYCKTCFELKNCEPYPYIDFLALLFREGQMKMNPATGGRMIIQWPK